ncbi:MAG TPA: DUF3857 domain-containing protein [Terracidiphilus sp.]
MRISVCLRGAALLLLAMLPIVLRASAFQDPTPEELKMTSDPAAPGASAVYLDYEETDNDPLHYESIYARIKVLTDKGKDLATVDLPYVQRKFKIRGIEGRTIHPDGSIVPLTAKPEDLMSSKSGDKQIGRMVFTLPSVTVGSILEYRYEISYDDNLFSSPLWEIQGKYYVHKAHYSFTPFPNFMPHADQMSSSSSYLVDAKGRKVNELVWWYDLPKGASIKQGMHDYSVDVTDVPAEPDEEYMPPIRSVLYKVFFYYSAGTAQEYWAREAKDWSKDVDKFAEPSKTIKEEVTGIVSPGDSELVKAQKIYKAVQALENTDYTRAKSASEMKALKIKEAKHAEDTWKQKSGSSEDIALLYLAMARAAGLQAFAMKVVDRDQALFDASLMDTDQLDDTLVLVAVDNKGMLLDPGEKMCTFGEVSWTHSDAGGMRQSANGPGFAKTPPQNYDENILTRSGDVTLDAAGGMTGYLTFTMRGQQALRWRQAALRNNPDDLKKAFDKWLQPMMPQGVEAHVDHFLALDDPTSNLMAIVKAKGTLGTALPKRLLLPGMFFESRGEEPFVKEEKRLEPVDMRYAEETTDELVYHLPAGYTVEGAPKDANELWKGHAQYLVKAQMGTGQITVERLLARAFDLATPEEYQDLRGFYQKVAAEDQSDLVLSMEPSAKGN